MSSSVSYEKTYSPISEELTEITIAGLTLKRGDILEIREGKNVLTVEFLGYNKFLNVFHVRETSDHSEMLIPYKNIKRLTKLEIPKKSEVSNEP